MKDKIRSGLTLGIYALLSVALIGVTNQLTSGYIKAEADRKLTAELSRRCSRECHMTTTSPGPAAS